VRRTQKGWLVNQTARRLVEEIQADWAERIGHERMAELRELLGDLVLALGFRYSTRIGGAAEDAIEK
jgi:hypothetical protein